MAIKLSLEKSDAQFLLQLLNDELVFPLTKEEAITVICLIQDINNAIEQETP